MRYLKGTLIYKIRGIRKKLLSDVSAALDGSGLTAELYFGLRFIYENPGCSQKELADLLLTDANIVVRGIDKMEERSLVRRERHPTDRRAYSLFLTKEGESLVLDKWEKVLASQEECLSRLPAEQRKLFIEFFDAIATSD